MITRTPLPRRMVTRPDPDLEAALALLLAGVVAVVVISIGAVAGWWAVSPLTWYLARGSGVTLYLLSWFLVVSGLGGMSRLFGTTGARGIVMSIHTYAFHLWYGMLALHMVSLMADTTMRFGLVESIVPFRSPWREPWTGLGVIAAELGLLVGASIGLKRLIGYRAWKALHWLSLPVFLLGLAHGVMAGTDSATLVMEALYVITGAWVVFLLTYRILTRSLRSQQREHRRHGSHANPGTDHGRF